MPIMVHGFLSINFSQLGVDAGKRKFRDPPSLMILPPSIMRGILSQIIVSFFVHLQLLVDGQCIKCVVVITSSLPFETDTTYKISSTNFEIESSVILGCFFKLVEDINLYFLLIRFRNEILFSGSSNIPRQFGHPQYLRIL